jgi:SprT protein
MLSAHDPDHLRRHLPPAAWPIVLQWLQQHPVRVHVVRPRRSKLGDYRSGAPGRPHRITVNNDLNPYAFLVTLVHEFAHHTAFERTKGWKDPHGPEWKADYQRLMRPYLSRMIFPDDVLHALERHLCRPAASSCADTTLMRVLRRYDLEPRPMLEELPDRTVFRFHDRLFVKGPKLRKRFRCQCLNDRRIYLIDAVAEVHLNAPLIVRKAS